VVAMGSIGEGEEFFWREEAVDGIVENARCETSFNPTTRTTTTMRALDMARGMRAILFLGQRRVVAEVIFVGFIETIVNSPRFAYLWVSR
jgi:hypothetical protein